MQVIESVVLEDGLIKYTLISNKDVVNVGEMVELKRIGKQTARKFKEGGN